MDTHNDIRLTKEEFIQCLNFIYKQREKQDRFIEGLEILSDNGEYCNCFCYSQYESEYVKLLRIMMNDENDDIEYFLYDLESGKNTYLTSEYYNTEEELYDFLIKQDKKRKEDKDTDTK